MQANEGFLVYASVWVAFFSFTLSYYFFHLLSHNLGISEGSGGDWQFRSTWRTLN